MAKGIVYVLSNPAMSGLVKIGYTDKDVAKRIRDLSTTSVPFRFNCLMAKSVDDAQALEKAMHLAFAPHRVNPNRDFFEMPEESAIAFLQWVHGDDVTPEVEQDVAKGDDKVDTAATAKYLRKRRRPPFNFHDMDIRNGSLITFKRDETISAEVVGRRQLSYNGREYSPTELTGQLLGLDDDAHDVQPSPYWTYKGRSLREIYDDFHGG